MYRGRLYIVNVKRSSNLPVTSRHIYQSKHLVPFFFYFHLNSRSRKYRRRFFHVHIESTRRGLHLPLNFLNLYGPEFRVNSISVNTWSSHYLIVRNNYTFRKQLVLILLQLRSCDLLDNLSDREQPRSLFAYLFLCTRFFN